jgi:hypothetical protein
MGPDRVQSVFNLEWPRSTASSSAGAACWSTTTVCRCTNEILTVLCNDPILQQFAASEDQGGMP